MWSVMGFIGLNYLTYLINSVWCKPLWVRDGYIISLKEIPLANKLTRLDIVMRRRLLRNYNFSVVIGTKNYMDKYSFYGESTLYYIDTGKPLILKEAIQAFIKRQRRVNKRKEIEEALVKTLLEGPSK
jgi:hypothetical protein